MGILQKALPVHQSKIRLVKEINPKDVAMEREAYLPRVTIYTEKYGEHQGLLLPYKKLGMYCRVSPYPSKYGSYD